MSALRGFKVLELSESVAGEYCGKLLADFGADLIKIEKPGCGSPTRRMGPRVADKADGESSGLFAYLNTNKQSVTLDLDSDAGRGALAQVLAHVDVVIDDHGSEWLQSLGLAPALVEAKRPALVLCSITPFGFDAADDRLHAEDLNVFHSSGWGYHTPSGSDAKQPPLKGAGRFLASYEAGMEAALCITAALFERVDSNMGRVIDISKQEVLASRVDYVLGQMIAGDMDVGTSRHQFDLFGPAGIFPCRDGYAYLWMSAPGHWDALRQLLNDPAWMNEFPPHWMERDCTPTRVAQCRKHIGAWLKGQNKHEVSAAAQKLGLTVVAVNNGGDLMACEQYAHRGFFAELDHPVLGTAKYSTVPYRMSATPAQLTTAAPLLGQHDQRLTELATAGGEG